MIAQIWKSGVFWAFLSTGLRLGGFIFVLPFTLKCLSSDHLGIWYTMQSLSSFVLLLEAGLSTCICRFTSFYFAGARKVPSLGLESSPETTDLPPNLPALAGLVVMARNFYRYFAFGILIVLGLGGGIWLQQKFGAVFLRPDVFSAYVIYTVGLTVMMAGFFWSDLLFGVNQVRLSFQNMIAGLVLNYVVTIVLFHLGYGLLSLAAGQVVLSLLPRWMARRQFLKVVPVEQVTTIQPTRVAELWPMCWRAGLSALGTYLLIRNLPLIAVNELGLKPTASLGLCLQLCLALNGISQIWMLTKYPVISSLRVKGDEVALRRLVGRRLPLCLLTYLAASALLLLIGPWALHLIGSRTPLLPTGLFALLLFVGGMDLFVGLNNALLLTSNRVPFMLPTIFSGIAATILGFVLGHYWGMVGIILAPALAQAVWNYWWTPLTAWRSLALRPLVPVAEVPA